MKSAKKYIIRIFKIGLIAILLFTTLLFFIYIPAVQNLILGKIESTAGDYLKAEVQIEQFHLGFWLDIQLINTTAVRQQDTLLSVDKVSIDVKLIPLFKHHIVLDDVQLNHLNTDLLALTPPSDSLDNTDTTQEEWTFKLNHASINHSHILYNDVESNINIGMNIGKMEVSNLSIDNYTYKVDDVLFEDSKIDYTSPFDINEVNDTSTTQFVFIAQNSSLQSSEFTYNDSLMYFATGGKRLVCKNFNLDVAKEKVRFTDIKVFDSYFNLVFMNDTLDTTANTSDWKVYCEQVGIANSNFTYDIAYLPEDKEHFDNNHIHFTQMNAKAHDIYYSERKIYGKLLSGSLVENNKVHIEQSSGEIYADNKKVKLKKLKIQLPNSSYEMDGSMGYFVETFDFTNNRDVDLIFTGKINSWNEVDYFAGKALQEIEGIDKVHGKAISIHTNTKGNLQKLDIDIDASFDKKSMIKAKGILKNLGKQDSLQYDFDISHFEVLKQNIKPFIDNPSSYSYIPMKTTYKGSIVGNLNKTTIKGLLQSDYGIQNIDIQAIFNDHITVSAIIDGSLSASQFGNYRLGHFTFKGSMQGSELSEMNAKGALQMQDIHIDTLTYDSLSAIAKIKDQHFEMNIDSKDPHAKFQISSEGKIQDSTIYSKTHFVIQQFNFSKNGIMDSPEILAFNSSIKLSYCLTNADVIFNADINHISLADSIERNSVKQMKVYYAHRIDKTDFNLYTDNNTIEAHILGNLDTLFHNFNTFIDILVLQDTVRNPDSLSFPDVSIYADINDPYELLGENVTVDLPSFSSVNIDANYINKNKKIDIKLFIPYFNYAGNTFDSTSFKIKGDLKGFDYRLTSKMYLDSMLHVGATIDGNLNRRKLLSHINLVGRENEEFIDVSFLSKEQDDGYYIDIPRDTILILSNKWRVNKDNGLLIEANHFVANNIELHRANKEIRIETDDTKKEIGLFLKNIDLSVFNTVLENDSLLAGNANIQVSTSFAQDVNYISLDAQIDTFQYENYPIGNINIIKTKLDNKKLALNLNIDGKENNASLQGIISYENQHNINLNVDIKKLNLDFLNIYTDYLYDVAGHINSNLKITGTTDKPIINGFFQFLNTKFGISDLQEVFSMGNNKVVFNNNIIEPRDLTIINKENHKAHFTGSIDINNNVLRFNNFHIKSDAMEIMNSSQENNPTIFGHVDAKFDVKMNGPIDDLNTKSYVKLVYPTVVNYTFPEDLAVSKNDDIVNFTKIDTVHIKELIADTTLIKKESHLMNIFKYLDAELIVDEGCKFNLYFDNTQENYVNATLEGDVKYLFSDNVPKTSGLLNIVKGRMNYSMPMVAMKQLEITDNSFIQITNEIENPYVSINAVSKIWAQTGDLIEGYNKNLEVKVFVYMRGTLDNLIIQFDVDPHTNDALVSSKISQMSEKERTMNAVNLLIRGQFASKQNNMTIDVNSYVNTLVAKALNKLISDRVSFVDMSFDIKSFNSINSSGAVEEQSNLFFSVKKSFYHDRIRINYLSNLSSTTVQNSQQYNTTDSYTERNFSIEYDISKNGNFQAVFFRKDTYEDVMEGEITSTGGGVKIRKSYNSFREILQRKSKKEKEKPE